MSNFSLMPTVSITRTKMTAKPVYKTSFNMGDLIPLGRPKEVLPGDTWSVDCASLIRMSTPIAPILDDIFFDVLCFFVPNRIVFKDWKKFQGESGSAGYDSEETYVPMCPIYGSGKVCSAGTIGDYMELPEITSGSASADYASVSVLPIRGYYAIYNRWFRDQNLIAPIPEYKDAYDASNTYDNYGVVPLKAAKLSDYFTRALPYAQKAPAVTLPLGLTAPLIGDAPVGWYDENDEKLFFANNIQFNSNSNPTSFTNSFNNTDEGSSQYIGVHNTSSGNNLFANGYPYITSNKDIPVIAKTSGVSVDLSEATAATVNQIRLAFAEQRYFEKLALYGSRYAETLKAFFGVTSSDASLQDPQYLGGKRIRINIDQVLSTAGYSASGSTTVGQPGANSVTGDNSNLFTFSATEHGYLFILGVARHSQTYGQGIHRSWRRKRRFDFYFPTFANIGAQSVKNGEIYATGTSQDEEVFAYQEAWSEYRYIPNAVTGLLNPSKANSLGFWTLANNFGSLPTLGQTFIEQDRNAIARALSTGVSGPDFIADFCFPLTVVRPMPMYSIPGLIDHH